MKPENNNDGKKWITTDEAAWILPDLTEAPVTIISSLLP